MVTPWSWRVSAPPFSRTPPTCRVWQLWYDRTGRLISQTDVDGRTHRYVHDAAGRLVRHVNAAGVITRFRYDRLGRLAERHAGTALTTFGYDTRGHLAEVRNADAVVRFERDPRGRVVSETINDRTVRTTYDGDRVVSRVSPSGRRVRWTSDARGLSLRLHTDCGHTVRLGWDRAGREALHTVDGRVTLRQQFDAAGRLAVQQVAGAERTFAYGADGRPRSIGKRSYTLDRSGRVRSVTIAGETVERYEYDGTGNLTGTGGHRWEFDGTMLLRSDDALFGYDGQGRVTTRIDGAGTWEFLWCEENRLVGVVTPAGDRWRYRYDGFGRRIAKQRITDDARVLTEVLLAWSGDLLTEQSGPAGTISWDFPPGSTTPVTQADHAGLHTIVTDMTGTPTHLIGSDGALRWQSSGNLWGRDMTGGESAMLLRFPGQYYDTETGLHDNRFRFYDPATARYLSPDPLGLAGGPNPFAYVANPLTAVDPLGLVSCKVRQQSLIPLTGDGPPTLLPSPATQPGSLPLSLPTGATLADARAALPPIAGPRRIPPGTRFMPVAGVEREMLAHHPAEEFYYHLTDEDEVWVGSDRLGPAGRTADLREAVVGDDGQITLTAAEPPAEGPPASVRSASPRHATAVRPGLLGGYFADAGAELIIQRSTGNGREVVSFAGDERTGWEPADAHPGLAIRVRVTGDHFQVPVRRAGTTEEMLLTPQHLAAATADLPGEVVLLASRPGSLPVRLAQQFATARGRPVSARPGDLTGGLPESGPGLVRFQPEDGAQTAVLERVLEYAIGSLGPARPRGWSMALVSGRPQLIRVHHRDRSFEITVRIEQRYAEPDLLLPRDTLAEALHGEVPMAELRLPADRDEHQLAAALLAAGEQIVRERLSAPQRILRLVRHRPAPDQLTTGARPAPAHTRLSPADRRRLSELTFTARQLHRSTDDAQVEHLTRRLAEAGLLHDQDHSGTRRRLLDSWLRQHPQPADVESTMLLRMFDRRADDGVLAAVDRSARWFTLVEARLRGALVLPGASATTAGLRLQLAPRTGGDRPADRDQALIPLHVIDGGDWHQTPYQSTGGSVMRLAPGPDGLELYVRRDAGTEALDVEVPGALAAWLARHHDGASTAARERARLQVEETELLRALAPTSKLQRLARKFKHTTVEQRMRTAALRRVRDQIDALPGGRTTAAIRPDLTAGRRMPAGPNLPAFAALYGGIGTRLAMLPAPVPLARSSDPTGWFTGLSIVATLLPVQAYVDARAAGVPPADAMSRVLASSQDREVPTDRHHPHERPALIGPELADQFTHRAAGAFAGAAGAFTVLAAMRDVAAGGVAAGLVTAGMLVGQALPAHLLEHPEHQAQALYDFERGRTWDHQRNRFVESAYYHVVELTRREFTEDTSAALSELRDVLRAMRGSVEAEAKSKVDALLRRRGRLRRMAAAAEHRSADGGPDGSRMTYDLRQRGVFDGGPEMWSTIARLVLQETAFVVPGVVLADLYAPKSLGGAVGNVLGFATEAAVDGVTESLLKPLELADRDAVASLDSLAMIDFMLEATRPEALADPAQQPARLDAVPPYDHAVLQRLGFHRTAGALTQRRLHRDRHRPNEYSALRQLVAKYLPALAGRLAGVSIGALGLMGIDHGLALILLGSHAGYGLLAGLGQDVLHKSGSLFAQIARAAAADTEIRSMAKTTEELVRDAAALATVAADFNRHITPVEWQSGSTVLDTAVDAMDAATRGLGRLGARVTDLMRQPSPRVLSRSHPAGSGPVRLTRADRLALDGLHEVLTDFDRASDPRSARADLDRDRLGTEVVLLLDDLGLRTGQPGAPARWAAVADYLRTMFDRDVHADTELAAMRDARPNPTAERSTIDRLWDAVNTGVRPGYRFDVLAGGTVVVFRPSGRPLSLTVTEGETGVELRLSPQDLVHAAAGRPPAHPHRLTVAAEVAADPGRLARALAWAVRTAEARNSGRSGQAAGEPVSFMWTGDADSRPAPATAASPRTETPPAMTPTATARTAYIMIRGPISHLRLHLDPGGRLTGPGGHVTASLRRPVRAQPGTTVLEVKVPAGAAQSRGAHLRIPRDEFGNVVVTRQFAVPRSGRPEAVHGASILAQPLAAPAPSRDTLFDGPEEDRTLRSLLGMMGARHASRPAQSAGPHPELRQGEAT
uniref:RHS repeat-associated core domain-containing protein n=1 Tax=Paractinoplanes polyasparticus TaxID=2856853 RepID=UPI001C84CD91|nr:RHS repeat-associated core domain-containing protein [Actinoplanes polyasparticus]